MNILAFDTCFGGCSVCVAVRRGDVCRCAQLLMERFETGHAERLMPMIAEVMEQARLTSIDLGRIAVTVGPGTFTGVRVGVAAARALGAGNGGANGRRYQPCRHGRSRTARSHRSRACRRRRCAARQSLRAALRCRRRPRCKSPPQLLATEDAAQIGDGAMVFVGSGALPSPPRRAIAAMRLPGCLVFCPTPRRWRTLAERSSFRRPLVPSICGRPTPSRRMARPSRELEHDPCHPARSRNVSILWAGPEHADEIAALHARLFDQPWDADSITQSLEHPGSSAFMAQIREPREIAGFIVGRIAADEAEILTLGVRTTGSGTASAAGWSKPWCGPRGGRGEAAVPGGCVGQRGGAALYKGLGFKEIGRAQGLLRARRRPGADAVILSARTLGR